MEQIEKVCKGLECCRHLYPKHCEVCEYSATDCTADLADDALSLIRQQQERIKELETAQTPRVMTLEEVSASENPFYFETGAVHEWAIGCCISGDVMFLTWRNGSFGSFRIDKYNKTWRCWTQRPTEEQREATPWND